MYKMGIRKRGIAGAGWQLLEEGLIPVPQQIFCYPWNLALISIFASNDFMKTPMLLFLLLFGIMPKVLQAQKNQLIATILLEGTNQPAPGIKILILGKFKEPLTTLISDADGKIRYLTSHSVLYLDIRSNDLDLQSTFERINLVPKDTSFASITLTKRNSLEAAKIKRVLQKLSEDKSAKPDVYTCTDYTRQNSNTRIIDSCFTAGIIYPEKAREAGISDNLQVKFIVDKSGQICNLELLSPTFAILEEEIWRAAASLSDLPVAVCKGKKFPAYYTLPVRFALE